MNVETVIRRYMSGEHLKFLFFWGHSTLSMKISKACLSQWYDKYPFIVDGVKFTTAEHYMMAYKAKLFGDESMFIVIANSQNPREVKKFGREIGNFDQQLWDANKFQIVVDGNYAKFSQNPELKEFLLNTSDDIIVEASPYDTIWGIGMLSGNADANDPRKWKGENLLGFALMEVRSKLK